MRNKQFGGVCRITHEEGSRSMEYSDLQMMRVRDLTSTLGFRINWACSQAGLQLSSFPCKLSPLGI